STRPTAATNAARGAASRAVRVRDWRFILFTVGDSRLAIHGWRFAVGDSRLTAADLVPELYPDRQRPGAGVGGVVDPEGRHFAQVGARVDLRVVARVAGQDEHVLRREVHAGAPGVAAQVREVHRVADGDVVEPHVGAVFDPARGVGRGHAQRVRVVERGGEEVAAARHVALGPADERRVGENLLAELAAEEHAHAEAA